MEATSLTISRGSKDIVKDVSLSVREGEIVGLLGPNGSGKSTLLDALAGGNPHEVRGQILSQGAPLNRLSHTERARAIAFVPQSESALFSYSVSDLVGMGRLAWNQGWRENAADRAAVAAALEKCRISHLADQNLLKISGGEHQMALFARALAQESSLILLDEPTANLDLARHALAGSLIRERCLSGAGVLVATHDINWALAHCQRLICLSEGRLIWSGPAPEAHAALQDCFGVELTWIETGSGPRVITGSALLSDSRS